MAYSAKTERLISIKKLSGKAQTSNDKGLINEGLPSGVTISYETVFGEPIPITADQGSDGLYTILSGAGVTDNGQVEYLRFQSDFIAGTVDSSGGRQGFQLKLPADYETNSKNPLAGTYPFINNQIVNITSGALQLIPPSFATGYEARPFFGGNTTKDSGDRIFLTDVRDWYIDYFNGVFFQQDPPGSGDHSDNPDFVQGYLYIGKFLSASLADAGGGGSGTPGGSDTQVQFNDGGVFAGDSGLVFNKTTNTLTTSNLSGSLTKLPDGTSYILSNGSIAVTTQSNGSIVLSAANSVFNEYIGEADGSNTRFTLDHTPTANKNVAVFVNGQLQMPATVITGAPFQDFSVTGSVVFFVTASLPPEGSLLMANYTTNQNIS
jgi:hypothetical protein